MPADGAREVSSSQPLPQRKRYRLLRSIASGGMAQVYEGLLLGEEGFERRVALKRILPQHADDAKFRRMFLREAKIASLLHHANIVQVLDFGVVDGQEFIVFEYVDGLDASRALLRSHAQGKELPLAVALHIVGQVGQALAYAHALAESGRASPVIHRDLSLSNILLSWEGDVKLADFGLASTALVHEATRSSLVGGKEAYLAPELIRGQAATPASDVYALGVALRKLTLDTPPQSSEEHAERGLRALIDDALHAEAAARPSAEAFSDRLSDLLYALHPHNPRRALRAWLNDLQQPEKDVHPFDQALGLCLVPLGLDAKEYTARAEAKLPADPGEPPDARKSVASPATPRRSPGLRGLWFALPLVVLALGTYQFSTFSLHPLAKRPLSSPPSSPRTVETASEEAKSQPHPETEKPSEDAPAATRSSPPGMARRRRPKASSLRDTPTLPAPASQAPASSPVAKDSPSNVSTDSFAWLRVGGARLFRARVEIDGRLVGHAPLQYRLHVGAHRLRALHPESDEVLLEKTVVLREEHRQLTPLSLIVQSSGQ